jgi:hypothetical protein
MSWSAGLAMTAEGKGVVAHAGAVPVRLLADRAGLTRGLSGVTTPDRLTPPTTPDHDRRE